jgi:hypothetical protein
MAHRYVNGIKLQQHYWRHGARSKLAKVVILHASGQTACPATIFYSVGGALELAVCLFLTRRRQRMCVGALPVCAPRGM